MNSYNTNIFPPLSIKVISMGTTNHGGLHKAAPWHTSPPPYIFVDGSFNFLTKIWLKSVVHGPDPFEDALKRLTTNPPS
jgi:hypothetical protein